MPRLARARPALAVVSTCALLAGCSRKPQQLQVSADCKTPEVVACLQKYAFEEMDSRDIERLLAEGVDTCFSSEPNKLATQRYCLPLLVGKDRRFGDRLALLYYCDDICESEKELIRLRYVENVGLEACCERGGLTFRRWSTGGGYGGCGPPEYRYMFEDKAQLKEYSLCNDD